LTPTSPLARRLRSWLPLLVVVVGVLSFRSAVANWYDVPTGSMQPTIYEGDRILVDRTAFSLRLPLLGCELARTGEPRRGDIVVLTSPHDGTRLVKRVVGLPGDTLAMRAGALLLDGRPLACAPAGADLRWALPPDDQDRHELLTEDLGGRRHAVMRSPDARALRDFGPVVVPADSYLVMGDNRDHSFDSRYFGFVGRDALQGRALAVVASVDRDRGWRPRLGRFFTRLD
jgi:signal peptidase I